MIPDLASACWNNCKIHFVESMYLNHYLFGQGLDRQRGGTGHKLLVALNE